MVKISFENMCENILFRKTCEENKKEDFHGTHCFNEIVHITCYIPVNNVAFELKFYTKRLWVEKKLATIS